MEVLIICHSTWRCTSKFSTFSFKHFVLLILFDPLQWTIFTVRTGIVVTLPVKIVAIFYFRGGEDCSSIIVM